MTPTATTDAMILRGGFIVDGKRTAPRRADIRISGDRIVAVGPALDAHGAVVVDCTDRYVIPGLIDMHSHADDAVFDPEIQLALLRQGVTTVVAGQDGVSYAPGDGAYAGDYFGGILGAARSYRGGGVAELLSGYDGATPVNVAYLVPLGTVRHEVLGDREGVPSALELARMTALVAEGLDEGAVGVSSGLDYVPGLFADTAELAALAAVAADAGKVYVSHMRGGYEHNIAVGIDEIIEISRHSGCRVHISHLHADPDLLGAELERMRDSGVTATFDAYPYRRACTLLGMFALPPALVALGIDEAVERLRDDAYVATLLAEWFPKISERADLGDHWLDNVTYAHVPDGGLRRIEGRSLRAAAEELGEDPFRLICRVLAATRLHTVIVARSPHVRSDDAFARVFTSPFHTVGSDGIYMGGSPHPRGWGSFARVMGSFVHRRGDLTWAQGVEHMSTRGADVLGLVDRGRLTVGAIADIAIVDPERVRDRATYRHPRRVAEGVDTVVVGGRIVLDGGELTGIRSGVGIRA